MINKDYTKYSDDKLVAKRENLLDFLETGMRQSYIYKLQNLLEIERELTIRETN